MSHFTIRRLSAIALVMGVSFITPTFAAPIAAHCPTNISQDSQGYWTSNDVPGWKSTESKLGATIDVKDFGGVVYSPEKKRIACVYKDNSGEWIVLLSTINYAFEKDALHIKGNNWQYNPDHQDYECGTPNSSLNDCEFETK